MSALIFRLTFFMSALSFQRVKPGKRVQKKEKTKRAILKAALELFAAKGFYASTTKAISKKGGALERGFRIGKLGFGLVGSYLGYQAQNLILSDSGKARRRARFQKKASQQVNAELGALKGAAMK